MKKILEKVIKESILYEDALEGMNHHNKKDAEELVDLHVFYVIRDFLEKVREIEMPLVSKQEETNHWKRIEEWAKAKQEEFCSCEYKGFNLTHSGFCNICSKAIKILTQEEMYNSIKLKQKINPINHHNNRGTMTPQAKDKRRNKWE